MFSLSMARRRGTSVLAVLLIGVLVLPYARAATCGCHDHIAKTEHCSTAAGAALTIQANDVHCDAMLACCRIDLGPVLNTNPNSSVWSFDYAVDAPIPDILAAVLQAPRNRLREFKQL